ncbi:MAG: hypothetical protein ACOCXZ_03445 [Chloroflexota bacterium]
MVRNAGAEDILVSPLLYKAVIEPCDLILMKMRNRAVKTEGLDIPFSTHTVWLREAGREARRNP